MIRTTPIGTRTLRMRIPFGRVHSLIVVPTGSGNSATSRMPHAISEMRFSVSVSRSSIADDKPAFLPASRSFALADLILSEDFSSPSAMARNSEFLVFASSFANARDASRERSASECICSFSSILQNHHVVAVDDHPSGRFHLDAANLRQAARKFNLLFVANTDHIAFVESAIHRQYPFGQQALTVLRESQFGAGVDNHRSGRALKKGDPTLPARQLVGMGQEDCSHFLAGQNIADDIRSLAVGNDERNSGSGHDLRRIDFGFHATDAGRAIGAAGESFDVRSNLWNCMKDFAAWGHAAYNRLQQPLHVRQDDQQIGVDNRGG